MNKAKEFLEKIGVDNKDVIVLLEEMLESAFKLGFDNGFEYGNNSEFNDTSDLEFKNWLNNLNT